MSGLPAYNTMAVIQQQMKLEYLKNHIGTCQEPVIDLSTVSYPR